jgi:hypothetical protein
MDAFRLRSLRFEVAVLAFDAMRLWLCAPHGEKLPWRALMLTVEYMEGVEDALDERDEQSSCMS